MELLQRFLNYTIQNTQSAEGTGTVPSTKVQMDFAEKLYEEVKALGVTDIMLDDKGYIYGRLASNIEKKVPVIAFIAHMDTALELPSPTELPRVIKNYDGSVVELNETEIIDPAHDHNLALSIGDDIVVTDGTTLLGGDDKAGVAEIVTGLEYMINHPEFRHGEVAFAFTPDEEIGKSVDDFDVNKLKADRAYTLDGGDPADIGCANFNASSAFVKITGTVTHPGAAKDVMKNAALIGMEFESMLPANERPEHTCGYEGFYHLMDIKADCQHAEMSYILRDPDASKFASRKLLMKNAAEFINKKYGEGTLELSFKESYRNMFEYMKGYEDHIEFAKQAIAAAGFEPTSRCIRGGTDGAGISKMGVPCPNLGTGTYNHHGQTEFANVRHMEKMVEIMLGVIRLYSEAE